MENKNYNSLSIILNQYKKDNITLSDTINLIEDLYRCKCCSLYIPYTSYLQQPAELLWTTTCTNDTK